MSFDGLDRRWEDEVNWSRQAGLHHREDLQIFNAFADRVRMRSIATSGILGPNTDFSSMGWIDNNHLGENVEQEPSHKALQQNLIQHFHRLQTAGQLEWLR